MGRSIIQYVRRHHVALLALFVALGGTSIAATSALLPKNSVGTAQVINNSLRLKDFKKSERLRLRGPRGVQGVQGLKGDQGAKGEQGIQGEQGPPATKLFASVTYSGVVTIASGVTGATRNSLGQYTVTFNRDLTNCVPIAVSGYGLPTATNTIDSYPVYASTSGLDRTKVDVVVAYPPGTYHDNGFDIAVFC